MCRGFFSLAPSDSRIAEALADAIARFAGPKQLSVVSTLDHDARALSSRLLRALAARTIYPTSQLQIQSQATDTRGQLQRQAGLRGPIVLIANPIDSANLLIEIKASAEGRLVFGGPSFGTQQFLAMAGDASEGAVFPILWHPNVNNAAVSFSRAFRKRYNTEPDYLAAFAFDATALLIRAIRRSGPNRAGICDAVRSLSRFNGVSGSITWDPNGRSGKARVILGRIDEGRIRALTDQHQPPVR